MSVSGALLLLGALHAVVDLDGQRGDPSIEIRPSEHPYVEARYAETVIRGRPWVPHRRVATIERGTRLVVRGEVASRDQEGCHGKSWYAVHPFGFVCSEHVRPTRDAPKMSLALPVAPGKLLPHDYAIVRDEATPSFPDEASIAAGIPTRVLGKGMSLVVEKTVHIAGRPYLQTPDGQLIPKEHLGWMGQGSAWRGVRITNAEPGPLFAWTFRDPTPLLAEPHAEAKVVERVPSRQRVPLWSRQGEYWEVGEGRWARAADLNEVHIAAAPPPGVESEQWVDIDVGEQVLVAYRERKPVYATLVSSGRGFPTPLGNYPVWAKVTSIDMSNQGYEDHAYLVQGVPWVLLFQGHNALHAAYWHDRFGQRKSHGCVNLAPQDARWVFEWLGPSLPAGWTGYLPAALERSPVVHVHDSSRRDGFTQERPWGPPDTDEERKRLEAAKERRALAAPPPVPVPSSPADVVIPMRGGFGRLPPG